MWLSSEFLNWDVYVQGYLNNSDADWERAYTMWTHAEQVLAQYSDEFHLIDAITTLKRATSHRLQLLKNTYNFDMIPVAGKPKRTIGQLAFWGIIRPTMLVRLIDIRNAVEHEDATPPPRERCLELLDFVWYFLRSTDRLTIYPPMEIVYESGAYTDGIDNTYYLALDINPKNNWRVNIDGWVNATLILESQQNDWFEVQISHRETRDEVRSHIHDTKAHENRKEDDLYIKGTIIGPESKLRKFFDVYFELALTGL